MKKIIVALCLFLTAIGLANAFWHGSPAFPVTNGQNLVLRAQDIALSDSATIASWNDTSGNANNLTQGIGANKPVFVTNGALDTKPYVAFTTESADFLTNTSYSVNKQAQSFFFVLDTTQLYSPQYHTVLGGGITLVYMLDAGINKRYDGVTSNITLTGIPSSKRVAILVTLGVSANKVYIDSSTNVQSLTAEGAGTITGIQLGHSSGVMRGKMYEVRGWNRELSLSEASQILDTWAPVVYGTGAAATSPPGRVIFDGDSITAGLNSTKSLSWSYLLNLTNGWLQYNYAVQGQTWGDLISHQAVTNTFANSSNYLIVNCGTNNLSLGDSAATIEGLFQTYMNAAVAGGFSKANIAVTTLSTSGLGAGGTARDDFNTWLRANYSTYAGYLIDVAADPNLGVIIGGGHINGAYYVDAAHFNIAGDTLMAALAKSTLGSKPFFNYLLKRDIIPDAANDNTPIWLNKVA